MLQELAAKQLDIYIAFVVGLICTIVGLALDRLLKSRGAEAERQPGGQAIALTVTQVTQVSIAVRNQASAEGENVLACATIALACICYLWFRQEILQAALLLTLGMVGLWCGVVLHSLYAGYLRGWQWSIYLSGMLVFSVGATIVLMAASSPAIAPKYFGQWQEFAHTYGLQGFVAWFRSGQLSPPELAWFVAHVFGIAALFLALKNAALSMFFCVAASSGGVHLSSSNSWLVRVSARHARPLRELVFLMILLVAAYYLVNGDLVVWLIRDFPALLQNLMHQLMYGARSN